MEDKTVNEQKNKEKAEDDFMKCVRNLMGLTEKPTIPKFPINKKAQKKLLREHFSKKHQNNSEDEEDEKESEGDTKEITKKVIYPSGIVKILTKNGKNQIINEIVDYKDIRQIYINNIKENLDKELIKIIENSFLLYNRRPIIRNIIKKPYSTKVLEEKILIWKFYIKSLTKDEKALLLRKLLYYIGKCSEKIYEEFIRTKEISKAYFIFKLKDRISKDISKGRRWCKANEFYMMNSLLGYDEDGNPKKEKETNSYEDEMKAVFLKHRVLDIKNELNGTGFGFIFIKELNEIGDMYTNSSYIFNSIFHECYDILDNNNNKDVFIFGKIETYRILWNFFVDYFIDDSFVMNFLIELKYIFGVYKQDDIVKYLHDLVLYRWNTHDTLDNLKKSLEKLLGPEEIYDEKEKVEKMINVDDVMKYIEGDEKPKKKKKKNKKKNKNKINMINQIEDDKNCNNNIDDYDDKDIDDSLSIISEADSVIDSFKNDIMEETHYNTGNKIIPQLSSQFLNQFQK